MRGPTLKVYFGFGSTWTTADASITWTEVTSKVLSEHGCQISRGRSTEFEDNRTGTCSFTLDNRGRLFDPSYTGSRAPFTFTAAELLPGLPVKVEAVANSTTIPVFRGFITGLPQEYPDQSDSVAVVPITAVDGMAKLANAGTPSSVYAVEVAADSPTAWWRLAETAGAVMGDASGNGHDGTLTSGATLLSGRHPNQWETAPAINFDREHRGSVVGNPIADFPFTAEWIVKFDDVFVWTGGDYSAVLEGGNGTYGYSFAVNAYAFGPGGDDDPDIFYALNTDLDGVSNYAITNATGTPGDARVAHHMAVRALSTGIHFYIDGALVESDTSSGTPGGLAVSGLHVAGSPLFSAVHNLDGALADVAVYDSDIGTTRIAAHATAFDAPWDGDTTGERIARILDLVGWPADLRDIATGLTTLGPATLGSKAGALVKGFEKAEQGRLFIARDGSLTFFDRYHYLTVTEGSAVQATFSDDGSDIPYRGFSYAYDTRFVFNRIRGSRVGGAAIEVFDQTSIDTYEEQVDASLENLQVGTDAEVRSLCELRLNRYKDPQQRPQPIQVALHGITAAQQATVLGLELGYRVNVERTPNDTGSAIDQDTLIESISHSISGGRWDTTITTSLVDSSPYGLWGSGLWGTAEWAA